MPDPDELRSLGKRLEEAKRQAEPRQKEAPPTPVGIAFRFATEMIVSIAVCGGAGWALDHWLGTRHRIFVAMIIFGAVVGIYNMMRAARELNAKALRATRTDDEEK